jgi:hypothetical protein
MFIKYEHFKNMNKLTEQVLLEALEKLHQDVPGLKERLRWDEHHQKLYVFGQPNSIRHKAITSPQDVPELKKEMAPDEVLFSNYITPGAKRLLREAGIPYLDKIGNVFLSFSDMGLVYVESRKNRPDHIKTKGASFNKSGLKLVYLLLKDPAYVNTAYRTLANEAKIALGSVSKVMNDLKQKGYLQRKSADVWILRKQQDLLKEWTRAFNETIRPDLQIGTYKSIDKDFYAQWQHYNPPGQSAWGGEPAAFKMTEYMKPAQMTIYTSEPMNVMRTFKLVPDPGGDFALLEGFVDPILPGMDLVDPVLVYADLVNTEDARAIETAQKIYEQHIQSRYQ